MRKNKFFMRIVVVFAICLAGMLMFLSCKKETNNPPQRDKIDGIYAGTLTTTNLSTNSFDISTPTIDLRYGTYSYEGLTNSPWWCCGSGNFTYRDDKITFIKSYNNGPTIGMYFDGELKGVYDYKLEGDSLYFSKATTFGFKYEFKLKKETGR